VTEKLFGLEPADTTSLWRELLGDHSVRYWVTAIDLCTIDWFPREAIISVDWSEQDY
jgi:hypothetical protein